MSLRLLVIALLSGLLAGQGAEAGEPPTEPFLRIEAAGHTNAIPRLAVDASGQLMASGSYDKTIRLWSLPDGVPRAVLRPPVGTQEGGEIYAVALSPDGKRLLAAGATGGQWDGTFCIYLFDTARGVLTSLLGGLPAPVNDLVMSPDGSRFAAGLASGGIREWDAATGKLLFEDGDYAGPVRSIVMDRDGALFSAASDGKLRVYDPSGHKLTQAATPSGLPPWGLALSPDGSLLAVTSERPDKAGRLHVDVLTARTLTAKYSPDTTGLRGEGLLAVAWTTNSTGGTELMAGGYANGPTGYLIRRWQDSGHGSFTDLAAAHDTIRHILALPHGGAVYATEDPGWGRIGPDGQITLRPSPPMADLRPARDHRMAVSADGGIVEFATAAGLERFTVRERTLAATKTPDQTLATAHTTAAGIALTGWRDSDTVRLNGNKLALDRNELARSAAIMPGGATVLLGTDTHLRLFDRAGHAKAALDIPAPALAVTVADGGHLAVAALLDGTVRWYGLDGGIEERGALFAHADGVRWVLFTPDGFFDDSDRGGNELVGIHLNRGRNKQPEWVSFSQAFRVFHAPDIVRARILGEAAPATAKLASLADIRAQLEGEPAIEVTGACAQHSDQSCPPASLEPGRPVSVPSEVTGLKLTVNLTDRGRGVGSIDMFVNDRNTGRTGGPAGGGSVTLDAPLDPGQNKVQLRVYDAAGNIFSQAQPILLTREQEAAAPSPASPPPSDTAGAAEQPTGRLFILAIGIDHYANPTLTLQFAVADARTFIESVSTAAKPIYSTVEVTQLLETEATKAGILAAFDRLSHEILPSDTFLFYVASHGVRNEDNNHFLLVPADLSDISSYQTVEAQAIDESALVSALSRIQARDALLFLDTCHSGTVTVDALANVGHETGRYMLAASSSVQEAMDSYDNHNGVFIYALREALAGRAGEDADGNLGALSLGEYVSRRVGQLARQKGHEQDAVFRTAQSDLHSFPIARIVREPAADAGKP